MFRISAATLCVLAFACAPRALLHGNGGYSPDGAPYRISDLPDGTLMPSPWRVDNYEDRGGVLRVKERADVRDLVVTRTIDDGAITVFTQDLSRREAGLQMRDLVNESLAQLRSYHWDGRRLWGGLQFEEVRKPYKEAVPGCEAVDLVLDARPRGTATATRRVYMLWMRPKDHGTLTTFIFESPIETFAPAYKDVLGFVERWSFP
jgi:hypothetical protein